MNKAIIYDSDGTLCDSMPKIMTAVNHILERGGAGRTVSIQEYVRDISHKYSDFYLKHGLPASVTIEMIFEWYYEAAQHHTNRIFDDVIVCLNIQRSLGYKLAMVTGQKSDLFAEIYKREKCLHLFDCILTEVNRCKSSAFRFACTELGATPEETYCVSDIAFDMRAAVLAKVIPVGMARPGSNTKEILREAGAEHVVQDLFEFNEMFVRD